MPLPTNRGVTMADQPDPMSNWSTIKSGFQGGKQFTAPINPPPPMTIVPGVPPEAVPQGFMPVKKLPVR